MTDPRRVILAALWTLCALTMVAAIYTSWPVQHQQETKP